MKVALVHTDLRTYWPARLRALAQALQERNAQLSVVEIAGRGSPYDFSSELGAHGELDWHILFPEGDLRRMVPRIMARSVEQKLEELQPDVVMAGSIAFPAGAAAVRWARRNHRAVIVFDDARRQDVPRSRVTEFVKRRLYANVDAVLIPSESHAPSYLYWGVPRPRIFFGVDVVDNGWFARQASLLQSGVPQFRQDRGLPSCFFLGVGRHVRKKNWRTCLSAYTRYREQAGPDAWGLVLVGEGPESAPLRERVDREGIRDVYLPGAVVGDELIRYYLAARAFILPSGLGETWGLVVNEALACGLPILVSAQCGCAETLVQEGNNGWTFSPDHPEDLAGRMLQMSGLSEREYRTMVSAARETIRPWGLERFVEGAQAALAACAQVNRGFVSLLDRWLIASWNGRFRPT
jgi:glycosyltransferase involved in cell wall biosynthesis